MMRILFRNDFINLIKLRAYKLPYKKRMLKDYFRFNYFYIIIILIWEPVQRFILKVDGAGYSITLLSIILLLNLIKNKSFYNIAFKKPLRIYSFWLLYAFVNILIIGQGYDVSSLTFFTQITVSFLLMSVIGLEYKRNKKSILNLLIAGMYLAVLLILLFSTVSFHGRLHGEINANTIGIMATILSMLLYLKYIYRSISIYIFFILMVMPLYIVISTGSRTAFGGVALLLILHFIINRSKSIVVNVTKITLGVLILLIPIIYLFQNSTLGERIMNTTDQSEGMDFQTGNPILDKFGDRGFFYYQGWEVFKEHPIMGIGLGNFKNYNSLDLQQHSEYMIQITELGVIGFLLFVSFYYSLLKNLYSLRLYYNSKKEIELYVGYILIILVMITATRMYMEWFMFIVLGMVIGLIISTKYLIKLNRFRLR